jgi:hypothetical protein
MDRYGAPAYVPHARQATCLDFHVFAPHRVWADEARDTIMAAAARDRTLVRPRCNPTPGPLLEVIRRRVAMASDRVRACSRAGWAHRAEGPSHRGAASELGLL